MIKHTIITKKPKINLPAVIQVETNTVQHGFPLKSNMLAIQQAIDAAQQGQYRHTKNKIKTQQEFNEFLDQIKVTAGEYATFMASRQVKSIYQIYYVHYVEVDLDKVLLWDHNGNPCPVHVILAHEFHNDRKADEWHAGHLLRPLSQEEKENVISDQVRNRIQERIRLLQPPAPGTGGT